MHRSIMSNERKCYVCGMTQGLHVHHVFFGPNRKNSDKWGCWVYLCARHHNMSNEGVHFNKHLDNYIKAQTQCKFESMYGHDEFMRIFGRNWL